MASLMQCDELRQTSGDGEGMWRPDVYEPCGDFTIGTYAYIYILICIYFTPCCLIILYIFSFVPIFSMNF